MSSNKLVLLSILTSIAILLFTLESLIPMPMPWIRIGLANLITLLVLVVWDLKHAILIVALRIITGSLILGKLFTPAFILSLGGGLGAITGMYFLFRFYSNQFSLLGISIFGAFIHNLVQLSLASLILVKTWSLFYLMPLMTLSAIFTGTLIGLAVTLILNNRQISSLFNLK